MLYIGIDQSLNLPAVSVICDDGDDIKVMSWTEKLDKNAKRFSLYNRLVFVSNKVVSAIKYFMDEFGRDENSEDIYIVIEHPIGNMGDYGGNKKKKKQFNNQSTNKLYALFFSMVQVIRNTLPKIKIISILPQHMRSICGRDKDIHVKFTQGILEEWGLGDWYAKNEMKDDVAESIVFAEFAMFMCEPGHSRISNDMRFRFLKVLPNHFENLYNRHFINWDYNIDDIVKRAGERKYVKKKI